MLYNSIKIIHILSGTIVVTTLLSCVISWWNKKTRYVQSIGIKTGLLILPFALLQLLSGFMMLNLHKDYLSQLWAKGSVISFIVGLGAWFLFLVFLNSEIRKPRLEMTTVVLCISSLLAMLYFMANKI